VRIIHHKAALRTAVAGMRTHGRIALVPTMGALHQGHLTLVREAKALGAQVVVSIFVNPRQFGAGEDLDAYPRQLEADATLLADEGVAILWAPAPEEVYPEGYATNISVSSVSEGLCGGTRPAISTAWPRWSTSCSIRCSPMSRCSARRTGSSSR
jgi:pantoate--beta-alanine ligase